MIFKIPDDYIIPDGLEFMFTDYCFGNDWSLTWEEGKWKGDNIRGRLRGNVINKLNKRNETWYYNENRAHKCFVMIKNDNINSEEIGEEIGSNGLMYGLFLDACNSGKIKTKLLLKNGNIIDGTENHIEVLLVPLDEHDSKFSFDGYDLAGAICKLQLYNENQAFFHELIPQIESIYLDMTIHKSKAATRLSFKFKPDYLHVEGMFYGNLDLIGDNDTIERIACDWYDSNINESSRDVELYLRKSFVEPIEELTWDGINPFKYIIDKQFYDIKPNPNAATTLYTDYNITSSKIITADNITTMRSDINVVSNNVDVIIFDVDKLEDNVDNLNKRMKAQEILTQYLKHKVNTIEIVSGVSLVLSIASTAMRAVSLGFLLEVLALL